ncbi:uncharacterized protein [Procambarus clarkii]|uniref:uncharacterized protein n=1 Tax=Procambarus clarkii TaxID=6728 RepID=UPI003742D19D
MERRSNGKEERVMGGFERVGELFSVVSDAAANHPSDQQPGAQCLQTPSRAVEIDGQKDRRWLEKERMEEIERKGEDKEGEIEENMMIEGRYKEMEKTQEVECCRDKGDSSPLKGDSSPLKGDSSSLKGDSSPLKGDSSSLKGDSSPLKGDSSSLKS